MPNGIEIRFENSMSPKSYEAQTRLETHVVMPKVSNNSTWAFVISSTTVFTKSGHCCLIITSSILRHLKGLWNDLRCLYDFVIVNPPRIHCRTITFFFFPRREIHGTIGLCHIVRLQEIVQERIVELFGLSWQVRGTRDVGADCYRTAGSGGCHTYTTSSSDHEYVVHASASQ